MSINLHRCGMDHHLLFIGLFITVHGVEVGGLLHLLAEKLVAATGGDLAKTGFAILWASAILSAIIDNIPFVATMIPLVKDMAPAFGGASHIEPLWWCLSLGLSGRQWHLDRCLREFNRGGHCRTRRHSLQFLDLYQIGFSADAGQSRHQPSLCLAALFLIRLGALTRYRYRSCGNRYW